MVLLSPYSTPSWLLGVSVAAMLCFAMPAAAQLQNNTGGGGTSSSLFGSGGSLFNGSGTGAGTGTGIGQSGFGQTGDSVFQLNQEGGSGGFVGRDSSDTGGFFDALNQQNQFLNQVQRNFAAFNRGRDSNQSVDAQSPIRVKLKLGFRVPAEILPASTAQPTSGRLNQLLAEKGYINTNAQVNQGVVSLTGVVSDDNERRMLGVLAKLEPGVSSVDNQLVVAEPEPLQTPTGAILPPPGS